MVSRIFQVSCLMLLVSLSSAWAFLYVQTIDGSWSGSVVVENHVQRVTLTKGYADVEEEATIRVPESSGMPAMNTPLEIRGTLLFPNQSAAVGMFVWNGTQILKANLMPSTKAAFNYESGVVRDSAAPASDLSPAVLSRQGDDVYSLAVYPVTIDGFRKVRLRYMVPIQKVADSATVTITPVLMGEASDGELSLVVKGSYSRLALVKNGVRTSYNTPLTTTLSNVGSGTLQLVLGSVAGAGSLRTTFTTPEWAGNYWLLNASIPDSIKNQSGLLREVVILWKWNFPEYYLDLNRNSLSAYGLEAVQQAQLLSSMITQTTTQSNRISWGLVHQRDTSRVFQFPLAKQGSTGLTAMVKYLDTITVGSLPKMVPAHTKFKTPDDATIIKMKQRYQLDFDSLIAKSVALYSPSKGVIRHLVIVSAGPRFAVATPTVQDISDAVGLTGISVSVAQSVAGHEGWALAWPGVNLNLVAQNHTYSGGWDRDYVSDMTPYNFLPIPREREVHYTAALNVNGAMRYYELGDSSSILSKAFHSSAAIDSVVLWESYDQYGSWLAAYQQPVRSVAMPTDSGVVKIVAAHPDVISNVYTAQDIGAAFGVVRTDYSLVASLADSLTAAEQAKFETQGLPNLSVDEIFVPEPVAISPNPQALHQGITLQSLVGGHVVIHIDASLMQTLQRVEILDMQGRRVIQLDHRILKQQGFMEWNGSQYAKGFYCVRFQTTSGEFARTFLLY